MFSVFSPCGAKLSAAALLKVNIAPSKMTTQRHTLLMTGSKFKSTNRQQESALCLVAPSGDPLFTTINTPVLVYCLL